MMTNFPVQFEATNTSPSARKAVGNGAGMSMRVIFRTRYRKKNGDESNGLRAHKGTLILTVMDTKKPQTRPIF